MNSNGSETTSLGSAPLYPSPASPTDAPTALRMTDDRSIDPQRGTWIAMGIMVLVLVAATAPYIATWGLSSLTRGWESLFSGALILGTFLGVVVHEGIHGLTWMLAGRLKRADIAFGMNWKVIAPFAHAKVPLQARAYRIGAAMPGLVMGFIPAVIATVYGLPALMIFATFYLLTAAGDMLVLWLLRGVPSTAKIQDHPTRWGCAVVA